MFDTGGIAGMLGRAHALLADAAVAISSDTTGPAATEALRETLGIGGQLDLITCLLTERVDRTGAFAADGAVSITAWLRNEAHSTRMWASQRVLAGRALADALPATRAAWTAGDLTFEHVGVIRRAIDGLDTTQAGYLDRALAAAAATATPDQLRDIAAVLLEEIAPGRREKDRDRKTAGQRLHLSDVPDGGRLDADLEAESSAILRAALNKYLPPEPTTKDDAPKQTLAHRRALALIEMARQSLAFGTNHPGTADKPHLVVTISAEQLRDELGVGYLQDGGTLPASALRRMACDAKITAVLLGSDGLPLDVGRAMRTAPTWMRTALNFRDKGCRHPDCDQPPSACEAHHVPHWIDGGKTSLDTMLLLCDAHHRRHHKGEFTVTSHGKQQFTITKIPIHQRT